MTSVVYFIASEGLIKIGTTQQLARRLEGIRGQSPIKIDVIGSCPGDARHEHELHARLSAYRKHGEWFSDCAAVRAAIEAILEDGFERNGISPERVQPQRSQTIAEAISLANIIIELSGLNARRAERAFKLRRVALWALKYRTPKAISASAYAELVRAADEAVEAATARVRLCADEVASLKAKRVDRGPALISMLDDIAGLKARLRGLDREAA